MRDKIGVRLLLDEEKIKREGKYSVDELYAKIDDLAKGILIKRDNHIYEAPSDRNDLANIMIFTATRLSRRQWFVDNCKEMAFLETDGDKDLQGIKGSNLMKRYIENKVNLWATRSIESI
ncbi:hypothetical protein CBLAS_0859 [Campylobacter blaseri]|uniref:Uncharacterized protein n=1 Tax=Campylobacter blaseri TaxID=2042961 RepID=A0A2P8R2M8_9BACT|nr:hypothetical protein [Campylobacter blaseri]PSM52739.1 hypothetical protein CQ405_03150 [Campylobacter blaseri]PSM54387.1 hypothetical protein CRN67_03150 [Campylobacter blaseri]QKF86044.1 hypothetical protein CBLAS_0859 [Campylobacter blaseri]